MKNIQVNEEKNLSSDAGQVSASRSGKVRRFHVETVSAGVIINAESFQTLAQAEEMAIKRNADLAEDNARLLDHYADECRASVLDLDESTDRVPELFQYDYAYRVAPCKIARKRCCACLEVA